MTQRRSVARVADRPNPANGTSEMSVAKRPFAACGKLCDRRLPFTDYSGRMIYMITADGLAWEGRRDCFSQSTV